MRSNMQASPLQAKIVAMITAIASFYTRSNSAQLPAVVGKAIIDPSAALPIPPAWDNTARWDDMNFRSGLMFHRFFHSQWASTLDGDAALQRVYRMGGWHIPDWLQHFKGTHDGTRHDSPYPPRNIERNRPSCHKHAGFVTQAIEKMISNGAAMHWGPASGPPPWLVQPLHVAEESSKNKLRLCYDAGFLNNWLSLEPFRLDTILDFTLLLDHSKAEQCVTADMKSWYLQQRITPFSCTLMGFEWRGVYYVYTHPAFGMRLSGLMCDKFATAVASRMRQAYHMRTCKYIDDWCMAARHIDSHLSSNAAAIAALIAWAAIATAHGWFISAEKTKAVPSTAPTWIGFIINTADQTFSITDSRLQKVMGMKAGRQAAAEHTELQLMRWNGTIASIAAALPGKAARIFTKASNRMLTQGYRQGFPAATTQEFTKELQYFDMLLQLNGKRKWRQALHRAARMQALASHDSSGPRWSFVLHGEHPTIISQLWEGDDYTLTMHVKEARSCPLGLEMHGNKLDNLFLDIKTDSRDFRDAKSIGGAKDPALIAEVQHIEWWELHHNTIINLDWWSTTDNWMADEPTRPKHPEVKLDSSTFGTAVAAAGFTPTIDLMASRASRQHIAGQPLPFIDQYHDPLAAHTNAFTVDLQQHNINNIYCFPPWALMGAAVDLICSQQVSAVIVVADKVPMMGKWQTPVWWPLVEMRSVRLVEIAPPHAQSALWHHKHGTWKPHTPIPAALYAMVVDSSTKEKEAVDGPVLRPQVPEGKRRRFSSL